MNWSELATLNVPLCQIARISPCFNVIKLSKCAIVYKCQLLPPIKHELYITALELIMAQVDSHFNKISLSFKQQITFISPPPGLRELIVLINSPLLQSNPQTPSSEVAVPATALHCKATRFKINLIKHILT